MAAAAKGAAAQRVSGALGLGAAAERGRDAAWSAINRTPSSPSSAAAGPSSSAAGTAAGDSTPAWAQRLRADQTSRHRRQLAVHMFGAGSSRGGGATPDIKERD